MRYARMLIFTLMIGMLTWKLLITQGPERMQADTQAGMRCGQLLFNLFVQLHAHDRDSVKEEVEKARQFTSYASSFNPDFFQGLLQEIKSCDVKSVIAKASLDQDGYARFLVMYYFLFFYCKQALSLENLERIDTEKIYAAAYALAAKTVYGDASQERVAWLKKSVHEFEQMIQAYYQ